MAFTAQCNTLVNMHPVTMEPLMWKSVGLALYTEDNSSEVKFVLSIIGPSWWRIWDPGKCAFIERCPFFRVSFVGGSVREVLSLNISS